MNCKALIGKGLVKSQVIGKEVTGELIGTKQVINIGRVTDYDEKTGIGILKVHESEFAKVRMKVTEGQNIGILSRQIV